MTIENLRRIGGNAMREKLVLIIMLLLVAPTYAAHESGRVGPFNVSFDMNTTLDYNVIVGSQSQGMTSDGANFTRYNLTVTSTDYFLWLILTEYDKPMIADINANEEIVLAALNFAGADKPQIYQPLIDGHPGVLGNFRFARQYLGQGKYKEGDLVVAAGYSPDGALAQNGEYLGMTDCRVISTFPWEVIRDMLYTLHVEPPKK